jgi:uncharacterized protein (DUF3084 family)
LLIFIPLIRRFLSGLFGRIVMASTIAVLRRELTSRSQALSSARVDDDLLRDEVRNREQELAQLTEQLDNLKNELAVSKVQYYQNEQGHNFIITIKMDGTLQEHSHQLPVTEKHLQEIEKTIEQQLQTQCETFINKMQEEIKVDCIDILKYALAKNRRALEKEIDNPEFIHNANIQVKVKVHLENTGEAR